MLNEDGSLTTDTTTGEPQPQDNQPHAPEVDGASGKQTIEQPKPQDKVFDYDWYKKDSNMIS